MTLNHLNLTVTDPIETSAFLAKYFRLQPAGGNAGMQMLRDDGGMVLTLMKARPDDRADGGVGEGRGRGETKGLRAGRRQKGSRVCVTELLPHRLHPAIARASRRNQQAASRRRLQRGCAGTLPWFVDVLLPGAGRVHGRSPGVAAIPEATDPANARRPFCV